MANVLKDEKKQQIIALGRLGWSLRKIQEATRVRRETISAYLRGAGVEIWPPGRWRRESKAKPAIEVIAGSEAAKPWASWPIFLWATLCEAEAASRLRGLSYSIFCVR